MTNWVKETKRPLVPQLPEEERALIGKIENLLDLPSWNEAENEEANRLSDEANGRREAWSTLSKGLSKKGGARNIAFTKGGIFADLRQELDARIEARKRAFASVAAPHPEEPRPTATTAHPAPSREGSPLTDPSAKDEPGPDGVVEETDPPEPVPITGMSDASQAADPPPPTVPHDPQAATRAAEEARYQALHDKPLEDWVPADEDEAYALCNDGNGGVREGRQPLLTKAQRFAMLMTPGFGEDRPSDAPPPSNEGAPDVSDHETTGGHAPPSNDDGANQSAASPTLAFGTAVPTPGVPEGAPPPADPAAPTEDELRRRDAFLVMPTNDWGVRTLMDANVLTYGVDGANPRPDMQELALRLDRIRTHLRTVLADPDQTPDFNPAWTSCAEYLLHTHDPWTFTQGTPDYSGTQLWRRWIAETLLRKSVWTEAEVEWVKTHRKDLHPKLRVALTRTPLPDVNEKAGDTNQPPLAQRTTEPPPPPMPARPPARTDTVAPPRRRPDKAAPPPTVETSRQKGSRWPLYLAAMLCVFAIGVLGSIIYFTIPPAPTGPTRTARATQRARQPPTPIPPGPNAIRPGPTQPIPPVASRAPSRPLQPSDLNVRNLERVRPEQINALPYTILFGRIDCGNKPPSRNPDGTLNYSHCRWREDPPAPRPAPAPTKTLAPTQRASTGPDLMA